jgi:hypothetical protein
MLRDGSLHAIRPGAYVAGLADDPAVQHTLLVRAALAELSPDAVVSHVSAAVLHGLRVWGIPLNRVDITRPRRRSGARQGNRVHVHCAPLDADEIGLVEGVPVTSVPRTVVDVARTAGFEQAVVVADSALEAGSRGHGTARRGAGPTVALARASGGAPGDRLRGPWQRERRRVTQPGGHRPGRPVRPAPAMGGPPHRRHVRREGRLRLAPPADRR